MENICLEKEHDAGSEIRRGFRRKEEWGLKNVQGGKSHKPIYACWILGKRSTSKPQGFAFKVGLTHQIKRILKKWGGE